MQALNKIKHVVDKVMEVCGIVILAIMTILVCYQVITRYVFSAPSAISEIAAQYLFVWMIMFGSTYVFGLREHLSIDILKDKFSPLMDMIVEILTNVSLLAFSAVICVYGGFIGAKTQMIQLDASLHIPVGLIYASLPFCGVIIVYYAVYNILLAISVYKQKIRELNDGDTDVVQGGGE